MKIKTVFAGGLALAILATAIVAEQGRGARQGRQGRGQRGQARNQAQASALKVGQMAPTFELGSLDGKSKYNLKDFRGEKPVVLFFGSYT